jgi:RNA polymerase sigma-70 factor (ECF subfamily)
MAIPKSKSALDRQFSSVANGEVESPGQQNTCVKQLSYATQQDIKDLFEKHYIKLCEYATAIVNDLQLAKDIVAEVFAKLLQEEVDRLPAHKLESYLFTIIDQKCREHIKQQQRTAKSASTFEVFTPPNATAIEEEISSLIYDELSKLPPQRQQIMIQLYMKGLTSKQVARRMKLSRQTVLNQKVRALKVLRNNILSRLF